MGTTMKVLAGIDVSKAQLDVHLLPCGSTAAFPNTPKGIQQLLRFLKQRQVERVCCESTGAQHYRLVSSLQAANIPIALANPRHVRDFARAAGMAAKTDRLDAKIIARFAEKMEPRLTPARTKQAELLTALVARRDQVQKLITQEKNRLEQAAHPKISKFIRHTLQALERQLAKLDAEIAAAIQADEQFKRKAELLASTPGVGPTTAAALLARIPELGALSRQQIGSLAGLAPMNRDSGNLRGKRTTGGGRRALRRSLYMPALVAVRHNPHLRAFYQGLRARGKSAMTALVAVMRKLLVLLNTRNC
jgi:transposase